MVTTARITVLPYRLSGGSGPLVSTAIHAGHRLRRSLAALSLLNGQQRLREEDPCTGRWAGVGQTRIVATRSRFEVDLNRPREQAVYRTAEDAWGLDPWRAPLPERELEVSLRAYDCFYGDMRRIMGRLLDRHGKLVVLDLHAYNHRRAGPDTQPDDAATNPNVNVGTGALGSDRRWRRLVERFLDDLSRSSAAGVPPNVRENVRFLGGHWPHWLYATFSGNVCPLAVEVKKTYMDEWTGAIDERAVCAIGASLESTVPGLLETLAEVQ